MRIIIQYIAWILLLGQGWFKTKKSLKPLVIEEFILHLPQVQSFPHSLMLREPTQWSIWVEGSIGPTNLDRFRPIDPIDHWTALD